MTGAGGALLAESMARSIAEEVIGHEGFVDIPQPRKHEIAEAAAHRVADEQRTRKHSRAHRHAAGDRGVRLPEVE